MALMHGETHNSFTMVFSSEASARPSSFLMQLRTAKYLFHHAQTNIAPINHEHRQLQRSATHSVPAVTIAALYAVATFGSSLEIVSVFLDGVGGAGGGRGRRFADGGVG